MSVISRARFVAVLAAFPFLFAADAWAVPDFDGDGFLPPRDCGPVDAGVAPGRADLPDLAFEDTNCDGIDGDVAKAIFVSRSTGDDTFSGSKDFPKRTINAGIAAAKAAGKDVYVTAGPYTEMLQLEDGVGVYGGYVPVTFARSTAEATDVTAAPQAALADGDRGVVLQLLRLNGVAAGGSGQSAYGLRAINGSTVSLNGARVSAGDGRAGANGVSFLRPPTPPRPDQATCGTGDASRGPRGSGGGTLGGRGGAAGFGPGSGTAGEGGLGPFGGGGGPAGASNQSGINGISAPVQGGAGANGVNATFTLAAAGAAWAAAENSTDGVTGAPGSGGGGGGGSGGYSISIIGTTLNGPGAGGGGGGAGGIGGTRGTRGRSGGGSFGAYLSDSALVASGSTLTAGRGGNGGTGGNGAPGGFGGPGGFGALCQTLVVLRGGNGGAGSAGGAGGDGGGGAGGPSAGVFRTGSGSVYTSHGSSQQDGVAGSGGTRGTGPGAPRAAAGQAAPILSAPDATGTTADFDEDGRTDSSDACPDVAAPAGDGDGCPPRPAKLPDADGDAIPNANDACPSVARGGIDANEDGCPDPAPRPNGIDADGDGFFAGQDCNDGNAAIRPGAQEVRGNAIDENCDGRAEEFRRIVVTLSHEFAAFARFTRLKRIRLKGVPRGSKVRATCKVKKRRCRGKARKPFVKRNASGTVSLNQRYRRVRLRVGTRITVTVTKPGFIGAVKVFKVRKRKRPATIDRCLPPGARRPTRC